MNAIISKIPLAIGQEFRIVSKYHPHALRQIYKVKSISLDHNGEPSFTATATNLKGEPLDHYLAFFPEKALMYYAEQGELRAKPMEAAAV